MEKYFKQLLLKDICSRLPYNPYCKVKDIKEPVKLLQIEVSDVDGILLNFNYKIDNLPLQVYLSEVKPYLRSLSSMTPEEKKYIKYKWGYSDWDTLNDFINYTLIDTCDAESFIDWLNENYFDYRGLIENGLAINATGLNIC